MTARSQIAIPTAERLTAECGTAFLSCAEALARALLDLRRADRAAGWNTAGFVSGYRGSPLGRLDRVLERANPALAEHDIVFRPGLNEELAATALYGAQHAALFERATVEGVFGLWYAKGPGVDRAGDALKHANFAGTAPKGGVIAVAGDDHEASSSTLAHQSDYALMAAHIPVLAPWDVQSAYDLALAGLAASRASGLWVGLKLAGDVAEASAALEVGAYRAKFVSPPAAGDLHIRARDHAREQERRMAAKRAALHAFARANELARAFGAGRPARLGIVAVGAAWAETQAALRRLGIKERDFAAHGIRVLVPALVWPLEPETLAAFADGLSDIVVIEDKRPLVEDQVKALLFNCALKEGGRPRVVGKTDGHGAPLLPETGRLSAETIAETLAPRLGLAAPSYTSRRTPSKSEPRRTPHYCPGCPHGTSTRTPDGSQTLAGIGCHTMALWTDPNTATLVPMGNEGAAWIGIAPFTATPHVFQNLGDGTYVHSGLLAIRAAVASGVTMTFKLLWNGAVAMTGGQELDAPLTVPKIARELIAEGVARVAVVTEDGARYGAQAFPDGAAVVGRESFDRIQDELRRTAGVTVLVYDQECAAELSRKRAHGKAPKPATRIFIDERLCEGCGDCTAKTNCLAIVPVATTFGEKRRIDQESCTQDLSCLEGLCPAIVTVAGTDVRRPERAAIPVPEHLRVLPEPPVRREAHAILIAGVGGRGVVTAARILARAALHDGRAASVLDQTGLAQKGGAVFSHVRIGTDGEAASVPRIGRQEADLVIGLDALVAAGSRCLEAVAENRTRIVVASESAPTAKSGRDPSARPDPPALIAAITAAAGRNAQALAAETIARACTGRAIAANLVALGFAFQMGALPLSEPALLAAIAEEDGDDTAKQTAFLWGRRTFADRDAVEASVGLAPKAPEQPAELVARLRRELVAYQGERLAERFAASVARAGETETARAPGCSGLVEAVARGYFKLLAAKDEYETARLLTAPEFRSALRETFAERGRLRYHLQLRTGGRKVSLGAWTRVPLRILATLKFVRGGPFDPFRMRAGRRLERALIREYEDALGRALGALTTANHPLVVELASLSDSIRGFGAVKERAAVRARVRQKELLAAIAASATSARAAE
jgi:indolepyruvate ferredoxin oxidoreductase